MDRGSLYATKQSNQRSNQMQKLATAIRDYFSKENTDAKDNRYRITLRSQIKQLADSTFQANPSLKEITVEVEDSYMPFIDVIFEDVQLNENYWVSQDNLYANQITISVKELEF